MTRVIHSLWPWTPDSGSTATAVPNVPAGLNATAASSTQINLTWNIDTTASPNQATYYEIESSTDGVLFSPLTTVNNPGTGSYSATGLSPSTQYWFRMSSCNTVGCSAKTASATATTQSGSLSPSWSLDFSSGTPSGYTLTRASTGTYVDSSGYVASASTDIARLTHNSSGSRLGLLVEGQRTNSLQRSEQIDNAYWTKDGTTCTGASIDAIAAPDNTTTADLILETATTAYHAVYRDVSGFTNNTAKVMSAFVKKQNRSQIEMQLTNGVGRIRQLFDIDAGATVGAINNGIAGSTGVESGIESFGNEWFRIWLTAANIGTNCNILLFLSNTTGQTAPNRDGAGRPSYAGNTSNGAYVWGCMIEDNATRPSSYIPTTTASVTRSADLVHVLDSSITNWGDPGALVVHFYQPLNSGTLISTDDAATAQVGIEASTTTAARAFWSSGSTSTGTIGTGVQKAVHYWTGSTSKFCINGGTVQSGTNNLTIGNTDFVTLGAEATESGGVPGTFSQYANCVIRKVEFYSGTLTDANLQTITT